MRSSILFTTVSMLLLVSWVAMAADPISLQQPKVKAVADPAAVNNNNIGGDPAPGPGPAAVATDPTSTTDPATAAADPASVAVDPAAAPAPAPAAAPAPAPAAAPAPAPAPAPAVDPTVVIPQAPAPQEPNAATEPAVPEPALGDPTDPNLPPLQPAGARTPQEEKADAVISCMTGCAETASDCRKKCVVDGYNIPAAPPANASVTVSQATSVSTSSPSGSSTPKAAGSAGGLATLCSQGGIAALAILATATFFVSL